MRWPRLIRVWTLLVLATLLAPGCRPGKSGAEAFRHGMELREIWFMYRGDKRNQGRVPKALGDFQQYQVLHSAGYQSLKRGECVVVYGVDLRQLPDPGQKVLAYVKDVPQKGGEVIMADGTVKAMSAEEFKAAPKAKT
jgi:hypothetical protein